MQAPDNQERALTSREQDPRDIVLYDDTLARLGQAAEAYVRGNVFDDYHRKKSEGTKQAQDDDLATFSRCLSTAGMRRSPDELSGNPRAGEGMKASTVVLFRHCRY